MISFVSLRSSATRLRANLSASTLSVFLFLSLSLVDTYAGCTTMHSMVAALNLRCKLKSHAKVSHVSKMSGGIVTMQTFDRFFSMPFHAMVARQKCPYELLATW